LKLPNGINNNRNSKFEGTLARTDSKVQVEHLSESDLPTSEPVQGRGGFHYKRTLSSFSLEGKVGVVTGGARGLGLMMSQSLIISGGDLAIVDLDSKKQSPFVNFKH
jgi:D-arabinitol 2-dehydrogenase